MAPQVLEHQLVRYLVVLLVLHNLVVRLEHYLEHQPLLLVLVLQLVNYLLARSVLDILLALLEMVLELLSDLPVLEHRLVKILGFL